MSAVAQLWAEGRHPASTDPEKWPERVEVVAQALERQGMSRKTLSTYRGYMVRAERWCAARGHSLMTAPADVVTAFVESRAGGYSTRRNTLSALSHYWDVLGRSEPPVAAIPLAGPRPARTALSLEPDEAARVAEEAMAAATARAWPYCSPS